MKLTEITKGEFRAKLKDPRINELRDTANLVVELIDDSGWVGDIDEEFEDDFVAWTIEARKEAKYSGSRSVSTVIDDFFLATSKYEDGSGVTSHLLNQKEDYALLGIQLDL